MMSPLADIPKKVCDVAIETLSLKGYKYLSEENVKPYLNVFTSTKKTNFYDIWLDGEYLVGEVFNELEVYKFIEYSDHTSFKSSEEWNKHYIKKNNITKLIDKL
jgi:hypothetical protein